MELLFTPAIRIEVHTLALEQSVIAVPTGLLNRFKFGLRFHLAHPVHDLGEDANNVSNGIG